MAIQAVRNSIGPYFTQFSGFVARNWHAFKNASVTYGTQISNSATIQKITGYVKPLINKVSQYYPNALKFSWSTGTAVVTMATTVSALALISYLFVGKNTDKATK